MVNVSVKYILHPSDFEVVKLVDNDVLHKTKLVQ